ncbi:MAG: CbtA family protein [Sedimenticolaceae bacterium]
MILATPRDFPAIDFGVEERTMLFRQIVFYSLFIGLLAGSVLTVVQTWQVVPIIQGAEFYEGAAEPALVPFRDGHGHSHSHAAADAGGEETWAPADGFERTAFTLLSNVLTAVGFSLVILAAMVATLKLRRNGAAGLDWRYGLIWGAAGYTVFWLAPALGLPPEIPLAAAAPLEDRQLWWIFAVLCTAAGLAGLAFGKSPWRWAALLLLVVPHLIGAPHPEGTMFAEQPPEAAAALEALAQQFIGATAIANAALWIVLGLAGGWALRRMLKSTEETSSHFKSHSF